MLWIQSAFRLNIEVGARSLRRRNSRRVYGIRVKPGLTGEIRGQQGRYGMPHHFRPYPLDKTGAVAPRPAGLVA